MSSPATENKKMYLRRELMEAIKTNVHKNVTDVCQKIFEQGFEIEQIGLAQSVLSLVMDICIKSNWGPK